MRLIFFVENNKNKRVARLVEEARKKNFDYLIINSYECQIGLTQLFLADNKPLRIKSDDVFWLASSALVNQFIIRFLKKYKNLLWNNIECVDFSNKYFGNVFFAQNQIKTPKTFLINNLEKNKLKKMVDMLGGFPLIIKNNQGSLGQLVRKVNYVEDIEEFIKKTVSNELLPVNSPFYFYSFILQEFIAEAAGVDYRVLCLENEIIGGIRRISQTNDFRANISLGGRAEVFDIPEDLAEICRKIMKKGKLFYAGLDFIKSKRGWLAVEVNPSAQFQGFEATTGINVAEKIINKLIEKKASLNYNM